MSGPWTEADEHRVDGPGAQDRTGPEGDADPLVQRSVHLLLVAAYRRRDADTARRVVDDLRRGRNTRRPSGRAASAWIWVAATAATVAAVAGAGWAFTATAGPETHALGAPATPPPFDPVARVVPAPGTRLIARTPDRPMHLAAGTIVVEVPPRPAGTDWEMTTPHGRVQVHGTRFTVAVDGEATRIDLAEGVLGWIADAGMATGMRRLEPGRSSFAADPRALAARRDALEATLDPATPGVGRFLGPIELPQDGIEPGTWYRVIGLPPEGLAVRLHIPWRAGKSLVEVVQMVPEHGWLLEPGSSSGTTGNTLRFPAYRTFEARFKPIGVHGVLPWTDVHILVDGRPAARRLFAGPAAHVAMRIEARQRIRDLTGQVFTLAPAGTP